MDATDQELRERYEQQEKNETPAVVDDQGDVEADQDGGVETDSGGRFGAIPTPSISQRQVALLAVVVAVVIAVYLYRQESSSGSPPDGEFTGNVTFEGPSEVDDGGVEDEEEIEVTVNSSDPMAADESVAEAFRDRGLIGGSD